MAQIGTQPQAADPECMAAPQNSEKQSDSGEKSPNSLAGKLGECEGILKPPATGDSEIAEPPPDRSKTPVIKPGELPPQQ
jgi:hypothetical protein